MASYCPMKKFFILDLLSLLPTYFITDHLFPSGLIFFFLDIRKHINLKKRIPDLLASSVRKTRDGRKCIMSVNGRCCNYGQETLELQSPKDRSEKCTAEL